MEGSPSGHGWEVDMDENGTWMRRGHGWEGDMDEKERWMGTLLAGLCPPPKKNNNKKTCDWNWVPLSLSVFALHSFVCGILEKFLESDHRLRK